jgi:hypothetical protein
MQMKEHTFGPLAAVNIQSILVLVIDGTYYIRWNGGLLQRRVGFATVER